jgi:ParB-like chromosome segregation protein Spo0J
MNRLTQLKAKLRAAQAELAIRTRTHNSASRAYNKVTAHITELEKRIDHLENLPKSTAQLQ